MPTSMCWALIEEEFRPTGIAVYCTTVLLLVLVEIP